MSDLIDTTKMLGRGYNMLQLILIKTVVTLNLLFRSILPVGNALLTARHAMSDKRTPPAFLR